MTAKKTSRVVDSSQASDQASSPTPKTFLGVLPSPFGAAEGAPAAAADGGSAPSKRRCEVEHDLLVKQIEDLFLGRQSGDQARGQDGAADKKQEEVVLSLGAARARLLGPFPATVVENTLKMAELTPSGLITPQAVASAIELNSKALRAGSNKARALGHVITRAELMGHLDRRRERNSGCMSLPVTILSFLVVATCIVWHLQLPTTYNTVAAITAGLGASSLSSGYPDTAWTWLAHLAGQRPAVGWSIVGGARLVPLPVDKSAEDVLWGRCNYNAWNYLYDVPSHGESPPPEVSSPQHCASYSTSGRSVLPWALESSAATAALAAIRSASFRETLDDFDGFAVQMLLKSEATDFYALTTASVEYDAVGLASNVVSVKALDSRPAWLYLREDWDNSRVLVCFDALFLGLWAAFLLRDGIALFSCCRDRRRCRRKCLREFTIWNGIDLLNVVVTIPTFVLYIYSIQLIGGLNTLVASLPSLSEGSMTSSELLLALSGAGSSEEDFQNGVDSILEQSARAAAAQAELVWYLSLLAISTSLRFFQAFRANPRLHVVTRTLYRVWKDVAHFLVVFCVLSSVFIVTGYMIFGSRIEEFSTLGSACSSVFLIVMGYLYDAVAPDMRTYGGNIGTVWIWLLTITFALIMLNMLLAIILDEYMGVRSAAGKAPSLLQQARELVSSKRRRVEALEARAKERSEAAASAWPGLAPDEPANQRREAILSALGKFNEDAVWEGLEIHQLHPNEQITSSSLAEALGAESWAARASLDALLSAAKREIEAESHRGEGATLSESIRICGRLETNLRDVAHDLQMTVEAQQKAEAEANSSQQRRADNLEVNKLLSDLGDGSWLTKALATGTSPKGFREGDLDIWDLSPPPTPPSEEEEEPWEAGVAAAQQVLATMPTPQPDGGSQAPSQMASRSGSAQGFAASASVLGGEGQGSVAGQQLANWDEGWANVDLSAFGPPPNARGREEINQKHPELQGRRDPSGPATAGIPSEAATQKLFDLCATLEKKLGSINEEASRTRAQTESEQRLRDMEASVAKLTANVQRVLEMN